MLWVGVLEQYTGSQYLAFDGDVNGYDIANAFHSRALLEKRFLAVPAQISPSPNPLLPPTALLPTSPLTPGRPGPSHKRSILNPPHISPLPDLSPPQPHLPLPLHLLDHRVESRGPNVPLPVPQPQGHAAQDPDAYEGSRGEDGGEKGVLCSPFSS